MPDGSHVTSRADEAGFTRHDRPAAAAFVSDAATEAALRDGLGALLPELEIKRGGVRAAIATQQEAPSPRILIVDVAGLDQPLAKLGELSAVVEPDTCVLVIGEDTDLATYREVTRGLGVAEYLARPVTRDLVQRYFGPFVRGQSPDTDRVGEGRLLTVTGARGGVGASVIAASLAWHFGTRVRRHAMLLDADLVRGTAALMLDTEAGEGLRLALAAPERIDALLAERAAQPVADRLHVLAARESPATSDYAPGACGHLMAALRRRYNVVVADVPWSMDPFCRDLLAAAQHRVIVLTPTLPSVRDTLRLLALPGAGAARVPTTLVLNRCNMPGGLKRAQVAEALRVPIDVAIPDVPRQVAQLVTLGDLRGIAGLRDGVAAIIAQIGTLRQSGAVEAPVRAKRFWRPKRA